jgi:5-hydroxyisourate hydrolase-like protein (transthyretin family)
MMLLVPIRVLAEQDGAMGEISGRLINGTTGKHVSGVEVILQKYQGEQEQGKEKAVSDPNGRFQFSTLDRHKGHSYMLQSVYKGVEYYSPVVMFDDQKQNISLDMTVYETTASDEKISVIMHHVLTEQRDGALWVREMMVIENKDNRVFVGSREVGPDKKETLKVSLPPKAQDLQLLRGLMSCCVVEIADGFIDTMDIKPGKKEYLFAYKIDYGSSKVDLRKRVNLRTASLNFFIPDKGIRANGENVEYAGLIGEPGNQFLHYAAKELARGSQVVVSLKGLPWGKRFFKKIVPILGVALLGVGLAYPLIRRRKESNGGEAGTSDQSSGELTPQEERQNILLAIAKLDDQFDSGKISQEEHDEKRRALKEKAIRITEGIQKVQ